MSPRAPFSTRLASWIAILSALAALSVCVVPANAETTTESADGAVVAAVEGAAAEGAIAAEPAQPLAAASAEPQIESAPEAAAAETESERDTRAASVGSPSNEPSSPISSSPPAAAEAARSIPSEVNLPEVRQAKRPSALLADPPGPDREVRVVPDLAVGAAAQVAERVDAALSQPAGRVVDGLNRVTPPATDGPLAERMRNALRPIPEVGLAAQPPLRTPPVLAGERSLAPNGLAARASEPGMLGTSPTLPAKAPQPFPLPEVRQPPGASFSPRPSLAPTATPTDYLVETGSEEWARHGSLNVPDDLGWAWPGSRGADPSPGGSGNSENSTPAHFPSPAPGSLLGLGSGSDGTIFIPFVALLALLALAAPATRRRCWTAPDSLGPTQFVCALERPG